MNIFCTDSDPVLSAQYLCDKHCVKMYLESCQLLCSVFHLQNIPAPYKLTHRNHPCAIWARQSQANFDWLLTHTHAISQEYARRYKKYHKCNAILTWVDFNKHLLFFRNTELQPFVAAIADDKKCVELPEFDDASVIDKYRLYYIFDKPFAVWNHGPTPDWYTSLRAKYNLTSP